MTILQEIENLIEESNNPNNYLYHYSNKKYKNLKTLNKQKNKESNTLDYENHISFHIDPLPLDLIIENFPKESNYFKSNDLFEYVVDINSLDIYLWEFFETDLDNLLYSKYLNFVPDFIFLPGKDKIKSITSYRGKDKDKLLRKTSKFKNKIRNYFIKWINSDNFSETSKTKYAASIPHLFVYPNNGIIYYESVKKIK